MADSASRRHLAGVLLAVGLMLLASCGGDDEEESSSGQAGAPTAAEAGPDGKISVPLAQENRSGASGTATLTGGGRASVTIELRGGARQYHAHVHDVSCRRYRGMSDFNAQLATVSEGLNDVTGGRSKTDLAEPLSSYTSSELSINVHEFDAPYPVVACGDLPSR